MARLKFLLSLILIILTPACFASNLESDIHAFNLLTDYKLLFLGGVFVILMQAGFAVAEGGYENNAKSIICLLINYIFAILGTACFGLFCFIIAELGWFENLKQISHNMHGWHWNLVFFYTLMATTITTIVGRIIPNTAPISVYAIMSFIISAIIFPFFGSWSWGNLVLGGGWLQKLGFIDFAGSTVVHSMAAWIVLAGYLIFKSQRKIELHKQDVIFEDYKILAFALAGFILWLAWSGLNVIYITSIHIEISNIVFNAFSALLGAIFASFIFSLIFYRKMSSWADLIKSALGGLVAITASCGFVQISSALIIGMVAGFLTLQTPHLLTRWIDSKHVREVIVVHGFCGIWGTLAVSLFNDSVVGLMNRATLWEQGVGVLINFVWSFGIAYIVFQMMRKMIPITEIHE